MRRMILAMTSVIALGLAGAGTGYAQSNATGPTPAAPSATTPTTLIRATPQAGATTQPDATTQPAMPSASQSINANQPYAAGTTPSPSGAANVSGGEVRQAQQKLQQDHLYRGTIDGRVGPEMQQALQQYQQKNGLPVTATLDQGTLNSLLGVDAGQSSSMPPNSSSDMNPSNGAGSPANANPNIGK